MVTRSTRDHAKAPKQPLFRAMVTWALAALAVTSILLWLRLASALRTYPWRLAAALSAVCFLTVYFLTELVRRRGQMQISLKMMVALVTLVAVLSSAFGTSFLRTCQRHSQVSAIQGAGGVVGYEVLRDGNGEIVRNSMNGKVIAMNDWRIPNQVVAGDRWLLPQWLSHLLGDDTLKHTIGANFTAAGTTDAQLSNIDFTGFQSIDLTTTSVSDAGLSHLAQYPEWRVLVVRNTRVTDAGMKYIGQLRELLYLDLSDTNITNVGLLELHSLQKLRYLNLWGTKVTRSGPRELSKALPHCAIDHDSGSYGHLSW